MARTVTECTANGWVFYYSFFPLEIYISNPEIKLKEGFFVFDCF